jgi:predicted NUDIX family NTP pyrophosphohydrolase
VLLYRLSESGIEVLIAHPGGPLWARRDEGAWSIPKGVIDPDEHPEAAARRELAEETGIST